VNDCGVGWGELSGSLKMGRRLRMKAQFVERQSQIEVRFGKVRISFDG
jgi:hypothetical protein